MLRATGQIFTRTDRKAEYSGNRSYPGNYSLVRPTTRRLAGQTLALRYRATLVFGAYGRRGLDPREAETRGIQSPPAWSPRALGLCDRRCEELRRKPDDEDIQKLPSGIYVMRADGTDLRQVADGLVGAPAWSPDGRDTLRLRRCDVVVLTAAACGSWALAPAPSLPTRCGQPDGSAVPTPGGRRPVVTMNDGTDQHILQCGSLRAEAIGGRGVRCGVCCVRSLRIRLRDAARAAPKTPGRQP